MTEVTPKRNRTEEALGHVPPHVKESVEEAAQRQGLIQCQKCKTNGKPMFFTNDDDLAAHSRAWHA
jgi:hypothetical protein